MVCNQTIAVDVNVRDRVGSIGRIAGIIIDARAIAAEGSCIPVDQEFLCDKLAVFCCACLCVILKRCPCDSRFKLFVTVVCQFDRALRPDRKSCRDRCQLRFKLTAESCAYIGADDPDSVDRISKQTGKQALYRERRLYRRICYELLRCRVHQCRVCLDHRVLEHRGIILALNNHIRLFKAFVNIAVNQLETVQYIRSLYRVGQAFYLINAPVLLDKRIRFDRVLDRVNDREQLVLSLYQADSFSCDAFGIRCNSCDRLTFIDDFIVCQNRLITDK